MNPVELKTLITALNDYLFCKLGSEDFIKLALFFSILSKEMLSMEEMRRICKLEEKRKPLDAFKPLI